MATEQKKPSAKSVGLEWFSLIFPDKTSRDLAVDRLQAQHVTTVWMGSDVVVEDPAGNRIHLKASE
ncbi:hypothetical protein RWE15_12840 [Virgibacillus halophilus]|uniref:Glyoxalase-like domain-containing protein n=1 Tax=Tigheibacillus halophilus TaxID=361280 RepID=A0ABU5C746_9BACI|nr:hypothetical protein [Virgibacillus halophilus]